MKQETRVRLFEGERALVITGLLGFVVCLVVLVGMWINGGVKIGPEGDLTKPLSFDAAFAVFYLTIAALLPLANFKPRFRKFWRWSMIANCLYSYAEETIQTFRGFDPRFTHAGTGLDQLAGLLLGLGAMYMTVLLVILMVKLFWMPIEKNPRPHLMQSVRYGMLTTMLALAAGMCMILNQGRHYEAGNILFSHAIGFHGLQTVPLIALLLERKKAASGKLVHLAGVLWMLFTALIGAQTALGHTIFEVAPLTVLATLSFIGWGVTLLVAVRPSAANVSEQTLEAPPKKLIV